MRSPAGLEQLDLIAQAQDLFVLLHQHGENHKFKGVQAVGKGSGSQVALGVGEQVAEGDLVDMFQSLLERFELGLLVLKLLFES